MNKWILRLLFAFTVATSAYSELCQNGGIDLNGVCVCLPEFTGEQCETRIFFDISREFALKEDTTFHRISRRSIKNCAAPPDASGSGSGAGSGLGSGEGEDKQVKVSCNDPEKWFINGECQITNMFESSVVLPTQVFSDKLTDDGSDEFKALAEKLECMVNSILGGVNGYVASEVQAFKEVAYGPGVEAHLVVRTRLGSDVTAQELQIKLEEKKDEAEMEVQYIRDIDECGLEKDICDDIAECKNTEGSYTCKCPMGYQNSAPWGDRPGSACRHVCEHKDGGDYCINGGVCHITLNSTGVCTCSAFYQGLRCERKWHVFLDATIGLAAALGCVLVIFVVVVMVLCATKRSKSSKRSDLHELESNSVNGEFTPASDNEIKGISNPYVSSDEGITVATNDKLDDDPTAPAIQEDRL